MTDHRDRLAGLPIAWCTGERAGVGPSPVPRSVVLGWFREGPGAPESRPSSVRHLLVTDVAAEGLDLQRAARVVHYDLPWTPMRLEQREGRAVRLGSHHPTVDIVRFAPPPPLERALGAIAGITEITSMSTVGISRITLQFDLSRSIDGAVFLISLAVG